MKMMMTMKFKKLQTENMWHVLGLFTTKKQFCLTNVITLVNLPIINVPIQILRCVWCVNISENFMNGIDCIFE